MKRLIYVAAIACLVGSSYSYANTNDLKLRNISSLQVEVKKTKITEEELPQTIQKLLKGDEYKDWKLGEAYLVKGASEYYKVELKKGDQKQTLNLDKYANKVAVMES